MYFEKINPKVWDDDIWLKHIYHEGSRSHVLSWNNKGSHCKEKNCIMNAPDEVMTKATVEGKSIHIFYRNKTQKCLLIKNGNDNQSYLCIIKELFYEARR